MYKNTKRVVINPRSNKTETITMLSPNIDDNSFFTKHSRPAQRLVEPEKDKQRKNQPR